MANPLKGEAALNVNGGAFTLAVDINALCAAEAHLEMGIAQILALYSQPGAPNLSLVRGLFWGALQKYHPCTIEQAGEILSDVGVIEAKAALEKAIMAAMPPPEEKPKKKAEANPKSRGNGSHFSKRGPKRGSNPKHSGRKPRAS